MTTSSRPHPRSVARRASDARITTNVDQRLGQRIRSRRLELGISQQELAERLGLTFQQVQKYEKGANRVAVSRLVDIAAALETPPASFLDGLTNSREAKTPVGLAERVLATRDGHRLMFLFVAITNERIRKRIVDLAEAVIEDEE